MCPSPSVEKVSTVDAFQGGEREIILLSTVRANGKTVGFTDDPSRLNVALSRAKTHLIVFGHLPTLERSTTWRYVLAHCKGSSLSFESVRVFYS